MKLSEVVIILDALDNDTAEEEKDMRLTIARGLAALKPLLHMSIIGSNLYNAILTNDVDALKRLMAAMAEELGRVSEYELPKDEEFTALGAML